MADIEHNGLMVRDFTAAVINLGRVSELTDLVLRMADSDAWRDYETGLGREQWREAELDYFLIACGVAYEDASRVLAWKAEAHKLAPLMDVESPQRRTLAEASAAWPSGTLESLEDRAQRLGWIRKDNGQLKVAPVPKRARHKARDGQTHEGRARARRAERIGRQRTRELDRIARHLAADLASDDERRYVAERIASVASGGERGRPQASEAELVQWLTDAERLQYDTKALARQWGIKPHGARRRIRQAREAEAARSAAA